MTEDDVHICKQCAPWKGDAARFPRLYHMLQHFVRVHGDRVVEALWRVMPMSALLHLIHDINYNQAERQEPPK